MKNTVTTIVIFLATMLQAQTTANRFYYELNYKPKKNSETIEKIMTVLDISDKKSLYQDYSLMAKDSLMKAQIEEMQKTGQFKNMNNLMTMPKFAYKILKKYPTMDMVFTETMLTAPNPIQLGYKDNPKMKWKIEKEKQNIGEYKTQKATTEFGGRKWTAWFTSEIPLQDGPYKFHGLPGLIVKIEDDGKNYSWTLKGNKKIDNYQEVSYLEKMQNRGGSNAIVEVTKEKFEKTFSDYKKDPFASIKSQMPAAAMSQKMPGSDQSIGELINQQEKNIKNFYIENDNPVEITK
jgi:GLPGLI family protein